MTLMMHDERDDERGDERGAREDVAASPTSRASTPSPSVYIILTLTLAIGTSLQHLCPRPPYLSCRHLQSRAYLFTKKVKSALDMRYVIAPPIRRAPHSVPHSGRKQNKTGSFLSPARASIKRRFVITLNLLPLTRQYAVCNQL